jgi:hypothetical protein
MVSCSINFDEIINHIIFEKLLKNDVGLYGRFIRNILLEDKLLKNIPYKTIHGYAKLIYRDIIERDLYEYIKSTEIFDPPQTLSNMIVTYKIDIDGKLFYLEIIYVRSIIEFQPEYFDNNLQCIIDIDSLVLTRNGISNIEIFGNSPYIFGITLSHIKNKKFKFKAGIYRLSSEEKKYLTFLKENGYVNINTKIEDIKPDKCNKCSICYDDNDTTSYIKLKCNHIYHKDCLDESVKLFFSKPDNIHFKCPYCAEKYLETELL